MTWVRLGGQIRKHHHNTQKKITEIIRNKDRLKTQYHQEQKSITAILRRNPDFFDPEKLLDESDSSVRECLAKILGTNKTSSSELMERLGSLSQGMIERSRETTLKYETIVASACNKLGLPSPSSAHEGEQAIAIHCFKEMYQKLSPTQKKEYENALKQQSEILKDLNPSFAPSMVTAGAIIAGQMSGFGVYIAASTLVGAITSTIGITLPFVFYTTMSSAISIFLGPVGWITVGAMFVGALFGKLFGPNFSKVTQGIILIASLRAEKQLEWQASRNEAEKLLASTSKEIQSCSFQLLVLRTTLLAYRLFLPLLVILIILFLSR